MKKAGISPKTEDILRLLGAGVLLTTLVVAPGLGIGIKAIVDEYRRYRKEKDWQEWQKFNLSRLRFILKRLERQKLVKRTPLPDGTMTLTLTEKGQVKQLKYNLEKMQIEKPHKWDGKWRLIIYDIKALKKREQELFRRMLRRLKMLPLQKSVFLYPYPCGNELEFLRSYFDVGEGVVYMTVEYIENDAVFRRYFGLS